MSPYMVLSRAGTFSESKNVSMKQFSILVWKSSDRRLQTMSCNRRKQLTWKNGQEMSTGEKKKKQNYNNPYTHPVQYYIDDGGALCLNKLFLE